MRLRAVIVSPMWECLTTGERQPLTALAGGDVVPVEPPSPGRLVGWVCVLDVMLDGTRRLLLAGAEAGR